MTKEERRQERIESGKQAWEERGPRWVHWLLNLLDSGRYGSKRRRFVGKVRCRWFCWFCHDGMVYLREQKRLDSEEAKAAAEAEAAALRALPSMQELLARNWGNQQ